MLRSVVIRGPGQRSNLDVRRTWSCPVCAQAQRHPFSVTSVRCGCTREGVPMKLAEEPRSPRIALRPDARAIIDRIQAGEVFERLTSPLVDSESGAGNWGSGDRRPPRQSNRDNRSDEPRDPPSPIEEQTPVEDMSQTAAAPATIESLPATTEPSPTTSAVLPIESPPVIAKVEATVKEQPVTKPAPPDDGFGAGIVDDPSQ